MKCHRRRYMYIPNIGDEVIIKILTKNEWEALPNARDLGWLGDSIAKGVMGKIGIVRSRLPYGWTIEIPGDGIPWHYPLGAFILANTPIGAITPQIQLPLPTSNLPADIADPNSIKIQDLYDTFKSMRQADIDSFWSVSRSKTPKPVCNHNFRPSKTEPGKTKWCTICDHRE
jgi:hypothetical protein